MMSSNSGKEFASSGADLCEVVFPYQGLNKDELTLRVGQVVTIINKDVEDAGWWKGELDGVVGVFPENFVKVIEKKSSDKKPERPPAMLSSNTTVKVDDTEKAKKLNKSISVEEKYDLDSLRKELTENMVAKSRPEVASKPDEIIPAINIMNVKKREKEVPEQLETFGDLSSSKLSHTTAGRVRPPKRRPPSQHFLKDSIPEDIILEVEDEEPRNNEKDYVKSSKPVPQIKMLDITQVKLRDSAKSNIKSNSPGSGGKPSWLAELSQKQAKRKSLDLVEEPKKESFSEERFGRSKSEYKVKAGEFKTTRHADVSNLGWDKRLFDTNSNLVEEKDTNKEITSLETLVKQMKNDVQDQLSQLKSEIAKERVARVELEKEVQNLKKKFQN